MRFLAAIVVATLGMVGAASASSFVTVAPIDGRVSPSMIVFGEPSARQLDEHNGMWDILTQVIGRMKIGVPTKDQMRALVASTATSTGVDPALALAVSYQESGFDHSLVSPANAIGAMQVIPSSGQWASDLVGRQLNLLDPRDNVTAGVAILKSLQRTSPDLSTAIAGYYQGATSVLQNGMYADTRQYVANVRALMARFA